MGYDYQPETTVMWDFRQFYIEWIKVYMAHFTTAQKSRNYLSALDAIQDWHSAIWGRVCKDWNKESTDPKFKELVEELVDTANEHKNTFLGKDQDAEGISKLNAHCRRLCSYVIFLMKKHKLFGTSSVNRSL